LVLTGFINPQPKYFCFLEWPPSLRRDTEDLFFLCNEGLQTALNLFLQVNLFCTGAPVVNSNNAIDQVNLLVGNSFIPNLAPWVSNLLETLGTRLFHTQECAFVLTMSIKELPTLFEEIRKRNQLHGN